MFQERFGKVDKFGWWGMYIIQTDAGTHFTSKKFQEGLSLRGVGLSSAAPYNQKMNGQAGLTWKTLRNIVNSIMEHAQVSD